MRIKVTGIHRTGQATTTWYLLDDILKRTFDSAHFLGWVRLPGLNIQFSDLILSTKSNLGSLYTNGLYRFFVVVNCQFSIN